MSQDKDDHKIAKELLRIAADEVDISSLYNSFSIEDQRKLYDAMKKHQTKITGCSDLIITGVDDDHDGQADRLKDIYHMPSSHDLYDQKDEPENSLEAKSARADFLQKQDGLEYRLVVAPTHVFIAEGDDLNSIARKQLETLPGNRPVSEKDVEIHMQNIASLNKFDSDATLNPGGRLSLPGYNGQGAQVTLDEHTGLEIVKWPETWVFTRLQDNASMRSDKDDKLTYSYPKNVDCNKLSVDQLSDDRKSLSDIAEHKLDKEAFAQFKTDMLTLETGVSCGSFPELQVRQTYHEIERLLTANNGAVSEQERILLAKNIMFHAAHPSKVSQGGYNTCSVTAGAEQIFYKHPAIAAKMIADTALAGGWTAPDGKNIKIDKDSLIPCSESRTNPPPDNVRSYATQILNVVMGNEVSQRREPPQFYLQTHPANDADNGERLVDAAAKPILDRKGIPENSPGITTEEIGAQAERLGEGKPLYFVVDQVDELRQRLDNDQLPIIVLVDPEKDNFTGRPDSTKSGIKHVVSVSLYNRDRDMVKMSNQWDKGSDRWLSVDELKSYIPA